MKWGALRPAVKPFLKSVLAGASVGSAPFVLLFIPMLIFQLFSVSTIGEVGAGLFLLILPFLVAFVVVGLASLMIGIPVTLFLARRGWERASSYILAGALCGGALEVIHGIASWPGWPSPLIVLLGILSGAATAQTWWVTARRPVHAQ
jgi:hypothetical protein